jgi:hypothetical protein
LAQARNQYTILRAGRLRSRKISGRERRFFSSVTHPRPLWGPPSFLFSVMLRFSGVKRPGCGADWSASSAEVKNAWSYASTVPCAVLDLCVIKGRPLDCREQCQVLAHAAINVRVPYLRDFLFGRSNMFFSESTVLCGVIYRARSCKSISTLTTHVFSSSQCPDRLWDAPSGCHGSFR